jgi:hypothetical protein
MNDRRSDDRADRDSGQGDSENGRGRQSDGPDGERGPGGRQGADTRFLQLEMSQVLLSEAEGVTKQALRELLLEAAKDRLRDRFGETITRLARLATDELLADIEASLDIEEQIQRRQESQGNPPNRLREALARKPTDRAEPAAPRKSSGPSAARKRRR